MNHFRISLCAVVIAGLMTYSTSQADGKDFTAASATDYSLLRLSQHRGKVVLIHFWRSTCGCCVRQRPKLIALEKKYRSKGLAVIGVSVEARDSAAFRAKLPAYLKKHGIPWRQVKDDLGTAFHKQFGRRVSALPTNFLISRDGIETYKGTDGSSDWKKLQQAVATETGKRPPARSANAEPVIRKAPSLGIPDLNGKQVTLKRFAGKPMIVHFFNFSNEHWAGKAMSELHRTYAQRGIQIVGVSLDKKPGFLPKYKKKYNVAYPLLVGTRQTQKQWIRSSRTWAIFFVNAKGEIVQRIEKSYQGMENSVYPWYAEYLLSSERMRSGNASRGVGKILDWKTWQQQGVRLYQNRQYSDAESAYSKAIALNPRNARLWNLRGVVRYRLKRFQDAVDDYSKALQLQPDLYWPRRNRAESFHRHLKQHARSIADYDVLLKTHSNESVVWRGRGCAHFKNRDYRNAIADLTKAIKKDPKDASALLWRGFAYRKLHQNGKAISDYSAALQITPNSHVLWSNRGFAYYYSGRYAEAVADFSKALKLNSKYEPAIKGRKLAQQKLKRPI